ncbi:penicillin-binding protein 2 [Mucilaginibacter gynuensis]|uniref:Penicillin-binding protein 2 n=1 Tax=Mucilaginibacter gynuensis TaxID=1302236 RepID=A0ABP8HIM8_9SPHI
MNSFFERRYIIAGIFITIVLVLLARLFYIQIVDDRYLLYAEKNVIRKTILYPARGPILDRNGKVLVQNEPVYDIMVVPKQVLPFDTAEFCSLIGIDKEGFDKRFTKAKKHSPYLASIFEKQLSVEFYRTLQERLSDFPGFFGQLRSVRTYPDSSAAQFLGFIGEANDKDIKRSNGYYRLGDYVGISGVEKAYESTLRGQRGVQNQMVDSRNVAKGRYANGAFDTVAVAGERLISSLDSRIQRLGEKLMQNKVGSIVAIEPSTGEILCFVSSPTYDPNLLVGRQRGNNVAKLYKDPYKPSFIRPIGAYYPPGSSFKPLSALIALEKGIITPQTTFFCNGGYQAGGHFVRCTHHHGNTNLTLAIAGSCNAYFDNVFNKLINSNGAKQTSATYTDWKARVNQFGFGVKLDIDMPNEGRGYVPPALRYDNTYGVNHWRANTIISLAIGQGELLATPLQLANIECTIANHGYYYKPHLIKAIGDKNVIKDEFTKRNYVGIDAQYFEPVIDGMQSVVEYGTGHGSKIPGIVMCGKTGTAQNPHGKNHSLFVAFAPRDNPKIAIAVVVENSGDGGTWAAPIASFIVEKYLRDTITRRSSGIYPEYYMNANLLPSLGNKPKPKLAKPDSLKQQQGQPATDTTKKIELKSAGRKKTKKANNPYIAYQSKRRENE